MGLRLEELKKIYVGPDGSRVAVIDIPELYIPDGEQAALIGTSGSGKTTLLHLIAGILTPDSGKVVFGYDPAAGRAQNGAIDLVQLSEAQRDEFRGAYMGYIFQTHHLLPGFTALENVLLGMTFTGRHHDRNWAEHLLREVGLSDRIHYRPQKLSVGQQQRVAVARSLANRPRLVLADEPTGALDSANAQQVLDLIRKLCQEVSASLLLVSHDLQIAQQLPRVLKLSEINRAATGYVGAQKP
jgi:putative ABC transport system ATP-binding protein